MDQSPQLPKFFKVCLFNDKLPRITIFVILKKEVLSNHQESFYLPFTTSAREDLLYDPTPRHTLNVCISSGSHLCWESLLIQIQLIFTLSYLLLTLFLDFQVFTSRIAPLFTPLGTLPGSQSEPVHQANICTSTSICLPTTHPSLHGKSQLEHLIFHVSKSGNPCNKKPR